MPVALDFEGDLRREIVKAMSGAITDPADRVTFEAESTRNMLVWLLNWCRRLVEPKPRKVLRARGFNQSEAVVRNAEKVNLLLAKIRIGTEVTPHLSKDIKSFYSNPQPTLKHRRNLDLLLNDWGIHHFHIQHELGQDGFVERGDPLLFGIVRSTTFYAIAVKGHGYDFVDEDLVREAVQTWPNDRLFVPLNVLGTEGQASVEDRHLLRRAHISNSIQVDGRVYMPALGMLSTAGTSVVASRRASAILGTILGFQREPDELLKVMRQQASSRGKEWPRRPSVRVRLYKFLGGYELAFFEERTELVVHAANDALRLMETW